MSETLRMAMPASSGRARLGPAAALGALGIVYGDIGTSPLYAFKQAADSAGGVTPEAVLGVVSVILWSLILIVSLKYATLIMRADNHGEGGICAMLALLDVKHALKGTWRASLLIVGLVGAALLYGDGVITPAISVLSAVEGVKLDAPSLAHFVVPISVVILLGLFLVQRHGTATIGRVFGPVMLVWFIAIALLGLRGIVQAPEVLKAISPHYAILYLTHVPPGIAFAVIGAAFLALTGAEAMYADMGHFGAYPIRLGWFSVCLPALMLNYFGQGAILLADAKNAANPFYLLAPGWAHYPMVVFATLATIVASQAVISGAYSLTQQAIQLGFLPRMRVLHTASHERGQIYMPMVNWLLAAGTLGAVLEFGSSDALGGAYGIAVSMLMAITTCMAALIALKWGYNPALVFAVNGCFLLIDLVFVLSNGTKLFEGGWFPLFLAFLVAFMMLTWRSGWALLEQQRGKLRQSEEDFIRWVMTTPPLRLEGTSVIFTAATSGIPLALTHHLKHNKVLRERVLLVSTVTLQVPHVPSEERAKVAPIGAGLVRVILHYGFMDSPNVVEGLKSAMDHPELAGIDLADVSYYFRRVMVIPKSELGGMAQWRKSLFALMHLNANLPAAYFCVPTGQVVEVGLEVEI